MSPSRVRAEGRRFEGSEGYCTVYGRKRKVTGRTDPGLRGTHLQERKGLLRRRLEFGTGPRGRDTTLVGTGRRDGSPPPITNEGTVRNAGIHQRGRHDGFPDGRQWGPRANRGPFGTKRRSRNAGGPLCTEIYLQEYERTVFLVPKVSSF